ncbi:MAG: 50S ribosome-binding GTPase [Kaiparowitsia implicata GSE-PSE-MK54-09C]|jgi:predicted GTPase|nr:50S ribosome-binding GTPase [Kaiparowitsia implicata GSE-PSE-MK54-09C]
MVRLKPGQIAVLVLPVVAIALFLLTAAGLQIRAWGLNWIWAVVTLALVGWRWLLVRWTRPVAAQVESLVAEVQQDLNDAAAAIQLNAAQSDSPSQPMAALQAVDAVVQTSQNDVPMWEDWNLFWQRCQEIVGAIARIYYPEVKYPLLNIYVPQAYGLIRGTVDDMDRWMQKLAPVLGQVSVGQAVQAYEVYRQLEPSARKLWRVWNWSQWLWNPAAAAARQVSTNYSNQANQQLLVNLSHTLRDAALRTLGNQAIALYSGRTLPTDVEGTLRADPTPTAALPKAKTQTLRDILERAENAETVQQRPVTILLAGRTGAGKSSLVNTLFQQERAEVNVLPSTDRIQDYDWTADTGDRLVLLDTPGYEQASRSDFRDLVLDKAATSDVVLAVTPALDPALQMDVDFLQAIKTEFPDLPTLVAVTQVDRLRPIREWQPPYDWQWGDRPKEVAIRDATAYRAEQLGEYGDRILPIVTADSTLPREAWGADALSLALLEAIAPAQQFRLARFLRNLDARTVAAARIIDQYTTQMSTTQGLTMLLKQPVLQFISTLTTGSPALAYVLAEKIPIEEAPVVLGKLQMAYELSELLTDKPLAADLLALWPVLLDNPAPSHRNAWAFGHALVEYWTQNLAVSQLKTRFDDYMQQ